MTGIKAGKIDSGQDLLRLLEKELVVALGCTEPLSVAYAAAVAARALGRFPERLTVRCSGNVVKNAKSVAIPGGGGLKGIDAAAALGALCGDPEKKLQALKDLTAAHVEECQGLLIQGFCAVELLKTPHKLHIQVEAEAGGHRAIAEILYRHTNLVRIELDGRNAGANAPEGDDLPPDDEAPLPFSLYDIKMFADTADSSVLDALLQPQITHNMRIAEEGLRAEYGLGVGRVREGKDIWSRIVAAAAAASDARMGGCTLPVVINSGSGNQGITASVPLIVYAREKGLGQEALLRGLAVSNLVSLHIKGAVGRLSAFCGVVAAACGSGAGITYLAGGGETEMGNAVINTLANVAGIVCDGAKASCAAKIASALDAALLGHRLAMAGKRFGNGDGIIKGDAEATIAGVGRLARNGMRETDREILRIMLEQA